MAKIKLEQMDNFHVADVKQSEFTVRKAPFIHRSTKIFGLKLLKQYGVKVLKKIPVLSTASSSADLYLYSQSDTMKVCKYKHNDIKIVFGIFSNFIVFEKKTARLGQFLITKLVHSLRNELPKQEEKSPKSILDKFKDFLDEEYVNDYTKTQIIAALSPFISTYQKRRSFNLNMCLSVVFSGEPGDGKTYLATKIKDWIAAMLRINSVEEEANTFQQAAKLAANFVAVIDDMNRAHFKRDEGAGSICQNILTEMDRPQCNRLFLLTTNEIISENSIDRAFFRPGRIQNVIMFRRPNEDLKNKIIDKTVEKLEKNNVSVDKDFIIGVKMFANEEELSLAEMMRLRNLIMTDVILENALSNPRVYVNKCKALQTKEVENDTITV